ncbi:MAG: DUF3108 domain-containing protein [Georgfuchsia sp.]
MKFRTIFLQGLLILASGFIHCAGAETGLVGAATETAPVVSKSSTPLPRDGQIEYALQAGDKGMTLARIVHKWHLDGNSYVLSGEMKAVGLVALFKRGKVTQRSEGTIDSTGLKPKSFRLDRGNGDIESASLDWRQMTATVTDKRQWPITKGTQDGLSIFYQIGRGAMPTEGLEMDMVSGRKVERYAFDWRGEETVSVPAGEYRAWRVRIRATSGDRDLKEVWLATTANLPVKIRLVDRKGEVLVMVAEKIGFEQ